MQDKAFHLFAADSDAELDDWVSALQRVVQGNDINQPQAFLERLKDRGLYFS